MADKHSWQFFRAGGVDQLLIRNGADIAHIRELDQKLWVALACPTRGIEFDTRTLDLIDTDHDGRVRPPEIIAACEWVCAQLRDPDELLQGGDTIALASMAPGQGPGASLADEARRILDVRGKPEADTLTLADVTDRSALLAAMRFNGDGVITPDTAEDPATRAVVEQIIKSLGGVPDRNGKLGIDRHRAEAFFKAAQSLSDWQAGAAASQSEGALPLDGDTLAAAQAVNTVRAKVDDFFARCRVAAYDPRAIDAMNPSKEDYEALGAQDLHLQAASIAGLPLAPIAADRRLPLAHGVNPAWADAVQALHRDAVRPLLGDHVDALSEADWHALKQRVAPCQRWLDARPDTPLGTGSTTQLLQITQALTQQQAVMALIEEDERIEPHNARIVELEKLIRLKRDLVHLLHNFVSFKEFYRREGAIFQAGTLYLDGRSCELAVQVADAAKHAPLAGLAKAYLAYCLCTREGKTMTIVAAFTAGDVDFLFIGRNGVFYDRQGRDWDATITKVIENPTSVSQAFFSPYKKFLRVIEEQVAKRAAASDTAAQGSLGNLATTLTTADKAGVAAQPGKAATPPVKIPGRFDVGTVAAIGVALGSISAVMVGIFSKFIDLGQWIPIALVGIVMAISGPSMLVAWLKLRQRSLGPILDASGWAINGRMRINVQLGGSLSQTAHIPPNSRRLLNDPFAERHGKAGVIAAAVLIVALAVLAWRMNWLDGYLPVRLQHTPSALVVPAA
ncbi:hypothetical protein [Variovorax ginsengisoli]|uniref:EF-hand domain-containing protein n=1 Tax=Variovorax ginsengisoli TaxID=363844 RepID=A0ABT9S5W1_9BURK|nr:hypothetical protein [Variovorax ginsengisoli]MDP9899238.1 hypothetical protein [Variovorax ginsengisoli]